MNTIKIIGVESRLQKNLKNQVELFIKEHEVPVQLEIANSHSDFLSSNIDRIPTINYNNRSISFKSEAEIPTLLGSFFKKVKSDHNISACFNCSNCNCPNKKRK